MAKRKLTVVRMDWAEGCIDEAFDRILTFNQNPKDVKKYLLDWLREEEFDVEVNERMVNKNGYLVAVDYEDYQGGGDK